MRRLLLSVLLLPALFGASAACADPVTVPIVSDEPATTGAIAPSAMDEAPAEAAPVADWIGKPIVSADGVEIGSVEDVKVDAAGRPAAVRTEVGGFMGFGGTELELVVDPTDFDGEEVRIGMVETDIDALANSDGSNDRTD
jgi:hypothetical protein